eukprot:1822319-Pyramimonas_sp.AAC.1
MPWGATSLPWHSSASATACAPCYWPGQAVSFTTTQRAPAYSDPLAQRPLIEGPPWRDFLPWDDTRIVDLAKAAGTTKDDVEH